MPVPFALLAMLAGAAFTISNPGGWLGPLVMVLALLQQLAHNYSELRQASEDTESSSSSVREYDDPDEDDHVY